MELLNDIRRADEKILYLHGSSIDVIVKRRVYLKRTSR